MPPLHSFCRCTTVAEFDDDVTEELQRRARDENGKSILVPQDMSYKEWKENYIINKNKPYIDLTNSILQNMPRKYNVCEQQYFIDDNGNKYIVDGKNVKMKHTNKEKEVAKILGKLYGGEVKLIPVVLNPQYIKTPDYIIENIKFDLKEPTGSSKNTIYDLFKHKSKQADNFIIDIYKSELDKLESIEQTQKLFYSNHRKWINTVILMENNKVFAILKRK